MGKYFNISDRISLIQIVIILSEIPSILAGMLMLWDFTRTYPYDGDDSIFWFGLYGIIQSIVIIGFSRHIAVVADRRNKRRKARTSRRGELEDGGAG